MILCGVFSLTVLSILTLYYNYCQTESQEMFRPALGEL